MPLNPGGTRFIGVPCEKRIMALPEHSDKQVTRMPGPGLRVHNGNRVSRIVDTQRFPRMIHTMKDDLQRPNIFPGVGSERGIWVPIRMRHLIWLPEWLEGHGPLAPGAMNRLSIGFGTLAQAPARSRIQPVFLRRIRQGVRERPLPPGGCKTPDHFPHCRMRTPHRSGHGAGRSSNCVHQP
jgi:hypothetical protein